VKIRRDGQWTWIILLTLLAACSGGSESYHETPLAANTSTSPPLIQTATPVVTAVRSPLRIPTPTPCDRIVERSPTGYPTPSPAESVAFLSDPDPANGGVQYKGRIGIGPYLGDSPSVTYILLITNESTLPLTIRTADFRVTARQPVGASLALPYFYSLSRGSFGAGVGEKATEYRAKPGQTTAAIFSIVPDRFPGTFDVEWVIQGTLGHVTVPVITPRALATATPPPPC